MGRILYFNGSTPLLCLTNVGGGVKIERKNRVILLRAWEGSYINFPKSTNFYRVLLRPKFSFSLF